MYNSGDLMLTTKNKALYLSFAVALFVWSNWFYWGQGFALSSVKEHWEITLTMVFASIIAGMTSYAAT
jgi:hypothetical protein